MKKIKMLFVAAMLCTGTYLGYNTYQDATMTAEEEFLQANIEALTWFETADGKYAMCDLDGTPYCCTLNGTRLPGRIYYKK